MPLYFQLMSSTFPIAIESMGNNWDQGPFNRSKGYPYYHWLQTESGKGEVIVAGERFILLPGQGILLPANLPHRYASIEDWKTCFVTFNGTLVEHIPLILGTNKWICSADTQTFSFSGWIQQVLNHYQKKTLDPARVSQEAYTFLLHLSTSLEEQKSTLNPLFQQYVAPTIKTIETNYAEDLSIQALAADCFISQQYLSRLFQRFIGKSPQTYLLAFRLTKGKELLVNSPELSIQEIGLRIGFHSTSRFIAAFKQEYRVTPNQFRKLHT
ncbi:helix-turn-helix domain-containing protein [Enterococcus sp. LJL98]